MEEVELPLPPEEAQKRLQEMGATIMFEKVLTISDTGGSGRVVIPKNVAETNFPPVDDQNGIVIDMIDVFGKKFSIRYRFWLNNASRMYLVEGTQELLVCYKLDVGDVLIFARLPSAQLVICGRKGTDEDIKKPAKKKKVTPKASGSKKRPRGNASAKTASGETKTRGTARSSIVTSAAGTIEDSGAVSGGDGEGDAKSKDMAEGTSAGDALKNDDMNTGSKPAAVAAKSKKSRQQKPPSKKDREGVNSMYEYWNGLSMPVRKDGVFRAVPATAEIVPDKVTAQHGHWTAVVTLGGELYQAFFDTRDAAVAAYNAASQG